MSDQGISSVWSWESRCPRLRLAIILMCVSSVWAAHGAGDPLGSRGSSSWELDDSCLLTEALCDVARFEMDPKRLREALVALEEAVDWIESQREVKSHGKTIAGTRSPAFLLASRTDHYKLWIDVLMRLAELEPHSGHDARAFEVHEQSRARNLLEALATNRRGAGQGRLDLPLSLLEARQDLLDDETVLLEYSLGLKRSFLWVVTSNSVSTFELPGRSTVEASVWRVYDLLTARAHSASFVPEAAAAYRVRVGRADDEYRAKVAELSQMLLAPKVRLAGGGSDSLFAARRIVVVAEGALQYLPFGALPTPGTEQIPLAFLYEVTSVPSTSVLRALRDRPNSEAGKTLAVVADPALTAEDANPRRWWTAALRRPDGPAEDTPFRRSMLEKGAVELQPLPGARREAGALERLVPRQQRLVALGLEASREMVLSGVLSDYRFIHFAAHSLLNSRYPDFSGLVLALVDEEGRPRDGFLRPDDVENLDLSAELVVLSGCRTALGQEIHGEGLVGLTSGFFRAGVPAVVASLWSPDDDATAALMENFYRGMLRDGLAPAAALREAQMAIAAQPKWSAPYYWAAFSLQGDWRG